MTDDSHPDLATATNWRGLKPGMTRADALRAIEAAGAEISNEDETDPGWLLAVGEKWGVELRFAEGGDQPLRQIALDDEGCHWAGRPLPGLPLHEALAVLGDAARGAGWRPEDATDEAFADLEPPGPGPFSDARLLSEATVWIRSRGLGLVMCGGEVNEIIWRRAEDVPRDLIGPVTEAQRQITARPDREKFLRDEYVGERVPNRPAPRSNPLQRILNLALVIALGLIGWQAWLEMQRWHKAIILTGKVVVIERATAKPWRDHYRVRFIDPSGRSQGVTLAQGEFYIPPGEIGAEVQVAYVPEDPPRVKGLAYSRDAAFTRYMPWAIGVGLLYMVGSLAAAVIARRLATPALPRPPGLVR
ncbi:MAG: hypothetical protein ABMA13_19420 [Chthoniobacteraceae bacterium]